VGWTASHPHDVVVLEGAALVQWVNASCVAQGLPLLVTDAGVIARICALVDGRTQGPARSLRRRDPATDRLQAPDGHDSVGVKGAGATPARQDGDVGDDSLDDGGLSVEIER
jgi:hypothetical protein